MRWVMDTYVWILETVLRSDKKKGFKISPSALAGRTYPSDGLIGVIV